MNAWLLCSSLLCADLSPQYLNAAAEFASLNAYERQAFERVVSKVVAGREDLAPGEPLGAIDCLRYDDRMNLRVRQYCAAKASEHGFLEILRLFGVSAAAPESLEGLAARAKAEEAYVRAIFAGSKNRERIEAAAKKLAGGGTLTSFDEQWIEPLLELPEIRSAHTAALLRKANSLGFERVINLLEAKR